MDVNGDGHPDLLVGVSNWSPNNTQAVGSVWAFDHRGQLLYQRIGADPQLAIGGYMAKLGDVDGDGCDDFIMFNSPPVWGPSYPGVIDVTSGRTGSFIRRAMGAQPGDFLGNGIAGTGDVDGDGLPDFIAGGGNQAPGTVQLFSSGTGQVLHAWYSGRWNDGFGNHVAGGIDFDRDGIDDIIATEPIAGPNFTGVVHVWSGRDFSEIFSFQEPAGIAGLSNVTAVPAQTGDAYPRLLVSGPAWRSPGVFEFEGRNYLFSGAPPGVVQRGDGCMSTLGRIPLLGVRDLGAGGVRVTVSGGDPGAGAILIAGSWQQPPIDLGVLGLSGCGLHVLPQAIGFVPLDATGLGFHWFRRPLATPGTGLSATGQWLVFSVGASLLGAMSEAMCWSLR